MSQLSERPAQAIVGQRQRHESAAAHVTGTALYTDDLAHRLSGVLHAYPVQSTHAHAKILNLEVAGAMNIPGVVQVITATDIPGVNDQGAKHDEPLLPVDEVMFYGQPVAWVVGENLESAKAGAKAVSVDYEPLESLITIHDAIDANSFHGIQPVISKGDWDAGFEQATHVFEGDFEFAGQEHFYLETQNSLALIDESGQVLIHCSTQHPTETQDIVSHVLGVPAHEVSVQVIRMGGGFGGKEMQPHGYAAIAALGAKLTGRPVRVRLDRTLDMTMTGKRHGFYATWKIGFDDQGRILALDASLTADGGWSLDLSEPVLTRAMCHIDNAYWIPYIRVSGRVAKCHKTSQTAFRGFGGPQGMLVMEDILGRVAPQLGIEARELRRRNFYTEGQDTPYYQPVRHPDRLEAAWQQVLDSAEVADREAEIAKFNAANQYSKRALALTPVKFGISFNLTAFNQGGALVLVYKDGSVLVNHGGTEMGQGLHTKMLQVAATSLGVPLSRVRLAPTRTDKVPNTSATAASSGSDLNGGAVKDACEQIQARLAQVAAGKFGVPAADIRFAHGKVSALGKSEELEFDDVVREAYMQRIQLSAAGYYRTEGLHWDLARMTGSPFKYFAYGVAASEVEVSSFDGSYVVRRVDIVHDVGDSLSPMIDLGQIEGGFVQGTGWLTLEDLRWDTSNGPGRGRVATQAASTYKIPSFSEMPEVFNVALLDKAHEEGAVYGSKAVGEPPLMLAFSVREALRQAIAAFGVPGRSVNLASPATPEAVFWAIDAVRE
ncbi:xanthine dehydrogenase molybdopterin binding subunit [Arthrobacter sp. NIO-1057]|uniref:xanthine dehydrogenase molybdopterin binding subunit n=1 Tax=Arthrobacter sp. NIO-1057 TaxID=993071 RepID=UPI00071D2AEC|nr:xanthine dehydrogenase molybdopterin binding subunit [Arthrobacter sp. NIO-1057]KSU65388.1 xanthine dehydrogenase [Arthrobacter sp. NIO-1057]SCC45487.1 xanthine dehydrogenase, molybdenum binding subunit apoprotein [Arthrobacter sp. NIO-1057]